MKFAIFYPFVRHKDGELLTGYAETSKAFSSPHPDTFIHTAQMCFLNRAWDEGYIIYVIDDKGIPVEIKNGMKGVNKELRKEHNIFRLWAAGALGNNLLPIEERVD